MKAVTALIFHERHGVPMAVETQKKRNETISIELSN